MSLGISLVLTGCKYKLMYLHLSQTNEKVNIIFYILRLNLRDDVKLTEKKRQNIIDAAIIEFRGQGFLGAKTTAIAKRAGVSSRTLYKHFESKEALYDALSEIMIARNSVMASVAYDPDRDLVDQLVEALNKYVAVITEPEAIGLTRMVIAELLRDLDRSRHFFADFDTHAYPISKLIGGAGKKLLLLAGIFARRGTRPRRHYGRLCGDVFGALQSIVYMWLAIYVAVTSR